MIIIIWPRPVPENTIFYQRFSVGDQLSIMYQWMYSRPHLLLSQAEETASGASVDTRCGVAGRASFVDSFYAKSHNSRMKTSIPKGRHSGICYLWQLWRAQNRGGHLRKNMKIRLLHWLVVYYQPELAHSPRGPRTSIEVLATKLSRNVRRNNKEEDPQSEFSDLQGNIEIW